MNPQPSGLGRENSDDEGTHSVERKSSCAEVAERAPSAFRRATIQSMPTERFSRQGMASDE